MADAKKKPKKKAPPVLTPEELRASAQKTGRRGRVGAGFPGSGQLLSESGSTLQSIPDDDASAALAREYLHQAEEISVSGYQTAYEQAVACKEHACKADDFYQAANAFRKIEEYQDASKLADECEKRYAALSHRKRPALVIALLVLVLLATAAIGVQTSFGKYELGRMALTTSPLLRSTVNFQPLGGLSGQRNPGRREPLPAGAAAYGIQALSEGHPPFFRSWATIRTVKPSRPSPSSRYWAAPARVIPSPSAAQSGLCSTSKRDARCCSKMSRQNRPRAFTTSWLTSPGRTATQEPG